MKIAIIDDEPSIREILRDLLEGDGHDIIEAIDGEHGLGAIRDAMPDLIICDINMPKMTGDKLLTSLRQLEPGLAVIPFIFLSGNLDDSNKITQLNNGADYCLQKPVDLNLLAAIVNSQSLRNKRVSDFINFKLDSIAESLPASIRKEFSSYKPLSNNIHNYVDAIVIAMRKFSHVNSKTQNKYAIKDELDYIKFCLTTFSERRSLVKSANGEDLSWTLIFMVLQAQLEELIIYVSDLYVSIPAAKSTINSRINIMVEDNIFIKENDLSDGRRQCLLLTNDFKTKITSHINTNITAFNQVS